MNYLEKPYLTLFVFSTLFLLFFSGLYTIYTIYYLPYFQTNYEWYFFSDKQVPTKLKLIFSGFQSGYMILHSLAIGIVLILLAKKLNTFNQSKKGIWQILITSFSLTTIYGALYFISELIWYKTVSNFRSSFSLGIIRTQLPFLTILYFILVIPIVGILYRTQQ